MSRVARSAAPLACPYPVTVRLPADVGVRAELETDSGEVVNDSRHGDDVHPASVAQDLAAVLPKAELHLYDKPNVMWNERAECCQRTGSVSR